jgi:hypothetical protein
MATAGIPYIIGTGSASNTSSSLVITTTATVPQGQCIVVYIGCAVTGTTTVVSGVSDSSTSATYVSEAAVVNPAHCASGFYVGPYSKGLASGGTITIATTSGSTTQGFAAIAVACPNIKYASPVNIATSSEGTATNFGLGSGVLAQAQELAFAGITINPTGGESFSAGGVWTLLGSAVTGTGSGASAEIALEYTVTGSTNALTSNISWGVSDNAAGGIVSLETLPGSPVGYPDPVNAYGNIQQISQVINTSALW